MLLHEGLNEAGEMGADLHEREVVHVAEDKGDRLRVEGLQGACHPPQPKRQRPRSLKVSYAERRCPEIRRLIVNI